MDISRSENYAGDDSMIGYERDVSLISDDTAHHRASRRVQSPINLLGNGIYRPSLRHGRDLISFFIIFNVVVLVV
jgi:hypothetical protein